MWQVVEQSDMENRGPKQSHEKMLNMYLAMKETDKGIVKVSPAKRASGDGKGIRISSTNKNSLKNCAIFWKKQLKWASQIPVCEELPASTAGACGVYAILTVAAGYQEEYI